MSVKRFSTPAPKQGPPIPFEVEVIRYVTETVTEQKTGDDGGTYDAPKLDADGQPVTHQIERRDVETFTARPDVSGGLAVQLELMGAQGRRNSRGADALFDFFDSALTETDAPRFAALIAAPDVYVHVETLGEIAVWLYGVYSGREERPTTGA